MALRLTVISEQRAQLGDRASMLLGVAGGSIGRAPENDWVLPDAQRVLSGRHARILFRDGAWLVEDTSTNGVLLNDQPVGRRTPRLLRDGDVLRLGDYRIEARIDAPGDDATPPGDYSVTATVATPSAAALLALPDEPPAAPPGPEDIERVVPLRVPPRAAPPPPGTGETDIGIPLNLESLLGADAGSLVSGTQTRLPLIPAGPAQQRLDRLRATTRALRSSLPPDLAGVQGGVEAFCRGAGIDPAGVPDDMATLYLAGRLLRESLRGLRDLEHEQALYRAAHGLETPAPDHEGPALAGAGVDEYLTRLLAGHVALTFDAVLALRAAFRRACRHDAATGPAMREALTRFLEHLDPANIDARRADGTQQRTSWEIYTELYRQLLATGDGQLPHLFREALAEAIRARVTSAPDG